VGGGRRFPGGASSSRWRRTPQEFLARSRLGGERSWSSPTHVPRGRGGYACRAAAVRTITATRLRVRLAASRRTLGGCPMPQAASRRDHPRRPEPRAGIARAELSSPTAIRGRSKLLGVASPSEMPYAHPPRRYRAVIAKRRTYISSASALNDGVSTSFMDRSHRRRKDGIGPHEALSSGDS